MHKLKTACIGVVFGAVTLASASAMPIGDLGTASKTPITETQTVVWLCGWYRCWWRPAFVYPAPYLSDRLYRAWGPYRGWGPDWGWRRWWW